MRKVMAVLNESYGSFGLSRAAMEWLVAHGAPKAQEAMAENEQTYGTSFEHFEYLTEERENQLLVQCVTELGDAASGQHARLKVREVEVPSAVDVISDDGWEHPWRR